VLAALSSQSNRTRLYRLLIQRDREKEKALEREKNRARERNRYQDKVRNREEQKDGEEEKQKERENGDSLLKRALDLRLQWPQPPELLYLDKHSLNLLSNQRPHNGFVLDAEPLRPAMIERLTPLSLTPSLFRDVTILLDCVTDPVNLGAMLRSCLFFGARLVFCAKNCAPLSPVAAKASSGASELVDMSHCKNAMKFVRESRAAWPELFVVALDADARAVDFASLFSLSSLSDSSTPSASLSSSLAARRPMLLVLGGEGDGVRPLLKQECESVAFIEAFPSCPLELVDSLNVSQALAIALYQCSR